MSATKMITDQYAALCQRLGDSIYKKSVLDREITEIQNQLQALNLVNASLQSKSNFLEKRRQESGAQSVEVVSEVPSLS